MTFKADSGPDKPSGGGDFAVRTSEVLAGDDRTLPDQLREAEAQRDDWKRKYGDCNEQGDRLLSASQANVRKWKAERERAEAAERKVDEVQGAARQLDDWATLVSQSVINGDYQRLKQIREGMSDVVACPHRVKVDEYRQREREWDSFTQMAEEELGKRNNRIAALEKALALAKELWGTVPEEAFAKIDLEGAER